MWYKKSFLSCFSIILLLFLLQACAGRIPLVKDDLKPISTVHVVRHQTPTIQVQTGASTCLICMGGCLTLPLGVHMATSRGQEAQKKGDLPDFGELVMLKFAERVPKEVPGWPEMKIENKPVAKDYRYKDTAFLEFKIPQLALSSISTGFFASTNVTMFNKNGKVIWRDYFMFGTSSHHKEQSGKDIKYWEDDNYKNLKEEMLFAADYTVTEFIKKLKTEK